MTMMMMLRRPIALKRIDGDDDYDYDGNNVEDSGAETAESDCSKMSSPTSLCVCPIDEVARRRQQQQQQTMTTMMMMMNMHLLANPGDSLLLQQTLDGLLRWLCPSLRIFHVSERAAPLRAAASSSSYARTSSSTRLCPATGYPSLAVTFFLHEAYGEQRILRVLDFLQRPPWQYHHTESGGAITEPGLSLQLAVKRLSPGVEVEPCSSAVLQFRVEEMGQLVPLLPNPCSPISASRWQTEDLDGNKILFQVKTPAQPPRPLTCAAFPPTCPSGSPRGSQPRGSGGGGHAPTLQSHALGTPQSWTGHRPGHRPRTDPGLEKPCAAGESPGGSDGGRCSSTPPGSSCYSSQRSSPCPAAPPPPRDSPLRRSLSHSLSYLLLEEEDEEEEEPETNVDTGSPVSPRCSSDGATGVFAVRRPASSTELSFPRWSEERPAAVGASALESLARELIECLPAKHLAQPPPLTGASRTLCKSVSSTMEGYGGGRTVAAGFKSVSPAMEGCGGRSVAAGRSPSKEPAAERTLGGTAAEPAWGPKKTLSLSARDKHSDELDEFFI